MKNTLIIFFLLLNIYSYGQKTCHTGNCIGASQIRTDTTLVGDILNRLRVDTTNWIASKFFADSVANAAGSGRKVDTLWRVLGIDSIYFKINGVQYAILDSAANSSPTGVDTVYRTQGKDSIQFTIGGRYHAILDSINPTDTTGLNAKINLKVDSVKKTNDTVYYYQSGIKHFAFLDSIGVALDTLKNGYGIAPLSFNGLANASVNVDSSALSTVYLRRSDSALYATFYQVGLRVKYSDTLSTIATQTYVNSRGFGTGSVTAVSAGLWMNFSTINTTGSVIADSATIAAYLIRRKDSIAGGYYPYSSNPKNYLTGNQTITLTGNVTGSGTTSIATTIGAAQVTNSMLVNNSITVSAGIDLTGGGSTALGSSVTLNADTTTGVTKLATQGFVSRTYTPIASLGSMAYADSAKYHGSTSITTLGTIATGVYQGTSIDTAYTNAASQVKGTLPVTATKTGKTITITVDTTSTIATQSYVGHPATYYIQNVVTTFNPANATTYYTGMIVNVGVFGNWTTGTTNGQTKMPYSCTIVGCIVTEYNATRASTGGTTVTMQFDDITTSTKTNLVAGIDFSVGGSFVANNLNIPVAANDLWVLNFTTPTWTQTPQGCSFTITLITK